MEEESGGGRRVEMREQQGRSKNGSVEEVLRNAYAIQYRKSIREARRIEYPSLIRFQSLMILDRSHEKHVSKHFCQEMEIHLCPNHHYLRQHRHRLCFLVLLTW